MAFIGNTPTTQAFIPAVDFFSGNGSTTAFTLSRPVASVAQIQAVVENVPQMPGDAYTVSGNTITFTSAPASGTNNIYVYYTSPITQVIAPSQGTVFPTSMSTGGPSWDTSGTLSATTLRSNTYQDASGGSNAVFSGVASPPNSMGFRNRILNGGMVIDQRNAGASVSTPPNYTLDRWKLRYSSNGGTAGTCTVQRSTTAPTGFTNSFLLTVGTARTVVSGDRFGLEQPIEGYNMADFGWGTANAQSVTLSFWVRSSLTGTFGLCFSNFSRGYAATYTISAANTWEYKTVTIVGDTSGTWDTTNGTGVLVVFDLGMGSDVRTTTGSWQAGTFLGATGATNVVSTNGATFYITGVQLEAGTVASPFERRDYGRELMMCQRYFERLPAGGYPAVGVRTTDWYGYIQWQTEKRTNPTVTLNGTINIVGSVGDINGQTPTGIDQATPKTARIYRTGSAFTSQAGTFYVPNYIDVSAEL